jgi:hypothetical protein
MSATYFALDIRDKSADSDLMYEVYSLWSRLGVLPMSFL